MPPKWNLTIFYSNPSSFSERLAWKTCNFPLGLSFLACKIKDFEHTTSVCACAGLENFADYPQITWKAACGPGVMKRDLPLADRQNWLKFHPSCRVHAETLGKLPSRRGLGFPLGKMGMMMFPTPGAAVRITWGDMGEALSTLVCGCTQVPILWTEVTAAHMACWGCFSAQHLE